MTVREIITIPHQTLKTKARIVSDFGPGFQQLVDDMIETMRDAPGVGLAAPQVNVLQRLIIVEYAEANEESEEEVTPKLYVIANPEVVKPSEETVKGIEGCLSIPEFVGEVERAESITIRGMNRHGKKMKLKAKGWLARIFQHEVDHLDGILFTDRAERIYRLEDLEQEEDEQQEVAKMPKAISPGID
jgi:peptide deformylase